VAINEQIVACLATFLAAPVPRAVLINVPAELIVAEPQLAGYVPGLAHGSTFLSDASERMGLAYSSVPENLPRFARLALLYSLVGAQDHQFIYENAPPRLVHSVDHGHFFPGGPGWTVASLKGAPPAVLDPVFAGIGFGKELRGARDDLASISPQRIAMATAAPPEQWKIPMDERVALARYLVKRRDELLAILPS
jgi:hypothetical protein